MRTDIHIHLYQDYIYCIAMLLAKMLVTFISYRCVCEHSCVLAGTVDARVKKGNVSADSLC